MLILESFGESNTVARLCSLRFGELCGDGFCLLLCDELDCFGLYGQVTKRTRWMPWQPEAMKDVVACDKARGAGKQALIRAFLNGATHLL